MANYKWDLKSDYMLAFTICKYGVSPEGWTLIANDLANYINATPQNCQTQFDRLCQQYGHDCQKQTIEPMHMHIFSIIKRIYYGDLCERMTESRDLLMVMYDFIRLFKTGRITSNDISEILQDVKNGASIENNTYDNDRQQKMKMLGRLKIHMTKQNLPPSDVQFLSFPVELLPPPSFFQQQSIYQNYISSEQSVLIINENDRQVPSIDNHRNSNATGISSFPIIIQSNNLLMENERQSLKTNQSNEIDIHEIELSSDDDNDRTAIAQMPNIDEPTTNSNQTNDQDDSTFVSDEPVETNQSSNMPPILTEISNSNDRDLYDNISTTSVSNQSTFDTRLSAEEQVTSSINSQPVPSDIQLNASMSGSSDYISVDNDRIQNQYYHPDESVTTSRRITLVDDEVARMDAEQIPEPIPADITDVAVPNDNAVFVIDEFISNTNGPKISSRNIDEQSSTSNTTGREMDGSSEVHENDESTTTRNIRRQLRLTASSTSNNYRKLINSILNNLKTAKYGYDFARPLKSFKLSDEYYVRIKKPLDIPEIRERMNNGDYDDNILLFERDILLMFTNALTMYHRDIEIHAHAQYMMNYAMELLTPIKDGMTPRKNGNDGDSSSIFRNENENNSDDETLNSSSMSSSIHTDSSVKNLRRQATSYHPMNKRQRKTTH